MESRGSLGSSTLSTVLSLSLESLQMAIFSGGVSGRGLAGRGLLRKVGDRGDKGILGGITCSRPSSDRDGLTGGGMRKRYGGYAGDGMGGRFEVKQCV